MGTTAYYVTVYTLSSTHSKRGRRRRRRWRRRKQDAQKKTAAKAAATAKPVGWGWGLWWRKKRAGVAVAPVMTDSRKQSCLKPGVQVSLQS